MLSNNKQMKENTINKLREARRQMMVQLEEAMLKGKYPEDSIFYYHSTEERIVLSHGWLPSR